MIPIVKHGRKRAGIAAVYLSALLTGSLANTPSVSDTDPTSDDFS